VAPQGLAGDEPSARTHHPHQDDRPGLHAARLQPHIIDTINRCGEINTFIPALAYTFAQNPVEIEVAHEERFAGESKYSLYSLIRLNFDLVTGFSVVPLQWLSFIGVILSLGSAGLFVLLLIRRFIIGAEVQGVFTLFAITFFLLGVIIFALGLLGEYIGRIYQQVRARPRYLVQTILEQRDGAAVAEAPRQALVQAVQAAPLIDQGPNS
jgi:undecaprenyl-phosphate 4-deoxy-4-formamido-L-arabinose transferase